jgi:GNAT superfamily N-acetyltransferase
VYRKFAEETLKSGEVMEVGCVQTPDAQWGERVERALGHKPPIWLYHIHKAVLGQTDDLEHYFYIGHLRGEIITGVMTVEYRRVGILGHVYTDPRHRRKGAYSLLMRHQMDDFRARGGGLLLLGTGYQSPPFRIYEGFGFRGIIGESGYMRYASEEDFEEKCYAPGEVAVRVARWEDWPGSNCLTSQAGEDLLRTVALEGVGQFSFEERFLLVMQGREKDPRRQAWSALSENGALVGLALLAPDARFLNGAYLLDLIVQGPVLHGPGLQGEAQGAPPGRLQAGSASQGATGLGGEAPGRGHLQSEHLRQRFEGGGPCRCASLR